MLFGCVHDSQQLFILNVVVGHCVSSHLGPVQHPLMKIPPAKLSGGITFQGDDRELLVREEDARASQWRRERGGPPASVEVRVIAQHSDIGAGGECSAEGAAEAK